MKFKKADEMKKYQSDQATRFAFIFWLFSQGLLLK